jgi:phage-related tail fiber protein
MSLHKSLGATDIHIVYAYTYANTAARTGATGFVPADVGKVAWQQDDNTFWVLIDDSPTTWTAMGGGGGVSDGDKGDITVSGTGTTWTIDNNTVTNAKLRDSSALSVIGRSANSSGDPADITTTASSDAVLRESGGVVGFGTVATAGIADDAVTNAKLRNSAATSVIGRSANSTGDPADIAASADNQLLKRTAGALAFGPLDDADHGNRGGGSLHALTVASSGGAGGSAGFQAPLDKEKLDQFKIPCLVATTTNITLSGTQTIDDVGVVAGNRVLVKNQSSATENGIYDCAAGAWARSFDADTTGELTPDTVVMVKEGTVSSNVFYCLANTTTPTLGSDAINWTLLSSPVDSTTPATVGVANSTGTSIKSSRADHVHAHGNQTVDTLHAVAVASVNGVGGSAGFETAFDKEKLNNFKVPVAVATTGNITLSGTQTIDGVGVVAADRVLVRAQTTPSENGIYSVSAGAWTRAFDCAATGDITPALVVQVKAGNTYNDIFFTSSTTPVINTDPVTFVQLSGVPGSATPLVDSGGGAVGTSVKFAREDHVHPAASGPIKTICRVATTANITLSGTQTIDGVGVVAGNRVLVKNQSTASQNGIYNCAAGAWTRSTDADATGELTPETLVLTQEGTLFADRMWKITNDTNPNIGSDSITWVCVNFPDRDYGDITTTVNSTTWTIDADAVTNVKLRNSVATSVIGRSANSTGDPADIAAATNGHVLRRNGTTAVLGFGEPPGIDVFDGATLLVPGTDWNITAAAPTSLDSINNAFTVCRFDDTTEEGRGFVTFIPSGAQEMKITTLSRAQTAPAGTRTVGFKLSYRRLQHNTAIPAWSTHTLTDISIPASTLYQVQSQTIALTAPTTDIIAGEFYIFEISRPNPTGGTELVGDWVLYMLKVEFF